MAAVEVELGAGMMVRRSRRPSGVRDTEMEEAEEWVREETKIADDQTGR